MTMQQLLERLASAWADFEASYAGLPPARLLAPGVTGQWSVRDLKELYARETRFRRRLRLDTYGHYPIHTRAIRAWRSRLGIG